MALGFQSRWLFLLLYMLLWIQIFGAKPTVHIGAVFQQRNYAQYEKDLREVKAKEDPNDGFKTSMSAISVDNSADTMIQICEKAAAEHWDVMMVVGDVNTVKDAALVGKVLGIPTIGYTNVGRSVPATGSDDLYLQMDGTDAVLAHVVTKILDIAGMRTLSVIMDKTYANYPFIDTFRARTQHDKWLIEDVLHVSSRDDVGDLKLKMADLKANRSRMMVLFCPVLTAQRVILVAGYLGLFAQGSGWILVDNMIPNSNIRTMQTNLNEGLVLVHRAVLNSVMLFEDVLQLVIDGTRRFSQTTNFSKYLNEKRSCDSTKRSPHATSFYSHLNSTTFAGLTGQVAFDYLGARQDDWYTIQNLIRRDGQDKQIRTMGNVSGHDVNVNAIIWPGDSMTGPITNGRRTFRIVTNPVMPFVMEQGNISSETCVTAAPCLRVHTHDPEEISGIFEDYKNGVHNKTRPWSFGCCSGLTISLLQKLAEELNFDFEIYLVADGKYGALKNGSWDGLVRDLLTGAAHMAVGAFSITSSRLAAIDFTAYYFQSGYSILVSEKKQQTINAVFEPFGELVWVLIAIFATITGISMVLLEWRSPFGLTPYGRKRDKNYTLASSMNMVWSVLFGHMVKTKTPKSWPCKVVQNFWAGASIFIVASFTANLASYIADNKMDLSYNDIKDPRLKGVKVGVPNSSSTESFVKQIDPSLYQLLVRVPGTATGLEMLMNGTIDVYLDDTPVLTYAQNKMNTDCSLKIVRKGFGQDGYGFGLPKNSPIKSELSRMILKYRDSGYIEDIRNEFFNSPRCQAAFRVDRDQMRFGISHVAGLFVMLCCGILAAVLFLAVEHIIFKYFIPYVRRKPKHSRWKGYLLMFFSQRMYRIVHSDELVSPNHSAKEMVDMFKKRQFERLFQKENRNGTQHKVPNKEKTKGKLFDLSSQLIWLKRQAPSTRRPEVINNKATQTSQESLAPYRLSLEPRGAHSGAHSMLEWDTRDEVSYTNHSFSPEGEESPRPRSADPMLSDVSSQELPNGSATRGYHAGIGLRRDSRREGTPEHVRNLDSPISALSAHVDHLTRDDVFRLWVQSEAELNRKIRTLSQEKALLQLRLSNSLTDDEVKTFQWV